MLSKQQRDILLGSLLGSAVAAAAVLLLTPASGAKIRSRLQEYLKGNEPKNLRRQLARATPVHSQARAKPLRAKARPKGLEDTHPHPVKKQAKHPKKAREE